MPIRRSTPIPPFDAGVTLSRRKTTLLWTISRFLPHESGDLTTIAIKSEPRMKASIPSNVILATVFVVISASAFFATFALYSHFSRKSGEPLVEDSALLGTPEFPAPETSKPPVARVVKDSPEIRPEPKPESPAPAREPEATPKVAEDATPSEPESPEPASEIAIHTSPLKTPPALDNSPDSLRDYVLSKERLLVRVPEIPSPNEDARPAADREPNSNTGAGAPTEENTDSPLADNPTDIPADPTDPAADSPSEISDNVREARLNALLESGTGETGVTVALTLGPSSEPESEPSEGTPSTAQKQPAPPATPARGQGRVVVGQNNLYSNALGGSVSGLIGGMEAPISSERVQYRPENPQVAIQHPGTASYAGTPDTTGTRPFANGASNNRTVPVTASNGTIVNVGANSGASTVTSAVPPGITNNISNAGNGAAAGPPLNLPVKAGFAPPGLTIRANAGHR